MTSSDHPQELRLDSGYHSVNPYFVVDGVAEFIDFLTDVFDGRESTKFKEVLPDGRIDHADVFIGDSIVMMSEGEAARPSVAFVFVPDVDASYRKALARGATSRRAPGPAPWGDRVAGFTDPWNNLWWVATPASG
jgi:PhnB protein